MEDSWMCKLKPSWNNFGYDVGPNRAKVGNSAPSKPRDLDEELGFHPDQ